MKSQVDASFYEFSKYVSREQFLSYYNQIQLILSLKPGSILEIGVGGNIIKKLLPGSITYTGFDLDKELNPSVVGNIEHLPFRDNAYDLVVCFEVLEHLPYEALKKNLTELSRVSGKDVIISLPFANNKFSISFYLPVFHHFDLTLLIPKFYRRHTFDGLHYWEIGKHGFPMKRIVKDIRKVFNIKKKVTFKDNTYHTFFVLQKKAEFNGE